MTCAECGDYILISRTLPNIVPSVSALILVCMCVCVCVRNDIGYYCGGQRYTGSSDELLPCCCFDACLPILMDPCCMKPPHPLCRTSPSTPAIDGTQSKENSYVSGLVAVWKSESGKSETA